MKKFLRGLASLFLKLSLFNLVFATALFMVFGTPDLIKRTLADSNLYESVVNNVIESSQAASQEEGFPINQPEVKSAIHKAFPPETIQSYSESFIDGTYNWLDGKVESPDFRIDLTPAKQKLAEGVADYAQTRYMSLPVCTIAQLRQLGTDVDPFNVPCQVPGVTAASARQDVINTIANSDQFLEQPVITAESLPKDAQGKNVFDNMAALPGFAKILRLAPWIFGITSLLLAAGLFALHDNKRSGLRQISVITIGTGLFVLISTLLIAYVFAQANKPGGVLNRSVPGSFQDSMLYITRTLSGELNRYVIIFSLAYIVLGGAVLLYLHFTDKKVAPSGTIADASIASQASVPTKEKSTKK